MAKILVLGTGPLLESGVRNFSAHCLRTWHLTKPLLDAGHDVRLFTMPIYSDQPETQLQSGAEKKSYEGFGYTAFLNSSDAFNIAYLNEFCASFKPDALVGINSYPCDVLARVDCIAPMWADLNGSVIIEGQVKAAVYGNNSLLGFYWDMEASPLRRADKFSVVSMRQLYALHGELASVGRLNRHTFDTTFAVHVPNAYNPFFTDPKNRELAKLKLRGGKVPEDAFVLLWSGGYNSWTNVHELMQSVERAMEACPKLHYVSTGGAIPGHDDLTYPEFQSLARRSKFRERFHLLGWTDPANLPLIYAESDLGLCVDAKNTETMFGARNRTVNMLAAGLPVLTTRGAEISDELVAGGYAIGCESGDPALLAEKIIEAYNSRESLPALGAKGRDYVLEQFSYERTTRELVAWAEAPAFAPDNQLKIRQAEPGANPFAIATNPIEMKLARMNANGGYANGRSRVKRLVERTVGVERYGKLRFLRNEWLHHYLPNYRERMSEVREGRMGKLEELYLFLTNACNARCKHCFFIDELGHIPGEMTLDDYKQLAPTMPKGMHITLTGGEAIMHPQCREIIEVLGRETEAKKITLISNAFLPVKLESLCASILEERSIPGILDVLISIDGLEAQHNEVRGNPKAWYYVNHTLWLLNRLRELYPDRFDVGVITIINDKNYDQLEALNDHLRRSFPRVRHGFEFIRGSDFSVWGVPEDVRTDYNPIGSGLPPEEKWDEILETLQRINRRAGIPNHAFHLTGKFTIEMLRTKKRLVDCVSAGQNVGVLYSKGELAACEFSKAFGSVRDYGMDFMKAWTSPEADAMRAKLKGCHCTHGCYLSKNIEYSLRGQLAMVKDL